MKLSARFKLHYYQALDSRTPARYLIRAHSEIARRQIGHNRGHRIQEREGPAADSKEEVAGSTAVGVEKLDVYVKWIGLPICMPDV